MFWSEGDFFDKSSIHCSAITFYYCAVLQISRQPSERQCFQLPRTKFRILVWDGFELPISHEKSGGYVFSGNKHKFDGYSVSAVSNKSIEKMIVMSIFSNFLASCQAWWRTDFIILVLSPYSLTLCMVVLMWPKCLSRMILKGSRNRVISPNYISHPWMVLIEQQQSLQIWVLFLFGKNYFYYYLEHVLLHVRLYFPFTSWGNQFSCTDFINPSHNYNSNGCFSIRWYCSKTFVNKMQTSTLRTTSVMTIAVDICAELHVFYFKA